MFFFCKNEVMLFCDYQSYIIERFFPFYFVSENIF